MSTLARRRPRGTRWYTLHGGVVLRPAAGAFVLVALAAVVLWQVSMRGTDGASWPPIGKADPLLLPRWAGFGVSWLEEVSRTVPRDKLVVHTELGWRALSSSCSALAATSSGRRLAYATVSLEPPYRLSREEEGFAERLRDMGYPGVDVRDSYNEIVVVDVLTGQKKLVAVLTAHPSLHHSQPKGTPVIQSGSVERLWWSGENTVYAQVGMSTVYRFSTESTDWTLLRVPSAEHARIEGAHSSPQGAPLALLVVDDTGTSACLADPQTLSVIWREPSAKSAPAYSPSGHAIAWVAATGDAKSRRASIAIRDLRKGIVKYYTPNVELAEGSLHDIWWIRRPEVLVVCGRRSVLFGTFEIGVWRVGSERAQRVGLVLDGVRPFTPL